MRSFLAKLLKTISVEAVFALLSMPLLAGPTEPSAQVIIDRVEVKGTAHIATDRLISDLEIPIGVGLTLTEAGEVLMEADRRLHASGRFLSSATVKLVRGNTYPHFYLVIQVEENDASYWGFEAKDLYETESFYSEDYSAYFRNSSILNLYVGMRNWDNAGWALDLESTNAYSSQRATISENGKFRERGKESSRDLLSALTATALRGDLLFGHGYFGFQGKLMNYSSARRYSSYSDYMEEGHQYHNEVDFELNTSAFESAGDILSGIRIGKVQIGADYKRQFTRSYASNFNIDYRRSVDGVPVATNVQFIQNSEGRFSSALDLSASWSDKTQISLIEPGFVGRATWSRQYIDNRTYSPTFYALMQQTWMLSDRLASTLMAGERWAFQEDYRPSSVERRAQLGNRLEYMTDSGAVVMGDYQCIGIFGSDYSDTRDHKWLLRNRFGVGVKYASPTFIYSLSANYGAEMIEDDNLADGGHTVDRILGGR